MDPRIGKVIRHCLEREPSQRPKSTQEVAAGLPKRDPLATALAEGRTPSPEIVANAGAEGRLAPPVAAALLAATVHRRGGRRRPGRPGHHLRPGSSETLAGALAAKARTVLDRLGLRRAPGRPTLRLLLRLRLPQLQRSRRTPALSVGQPLATGEFPAVGFWFRQSPQYLVASGMTTADLPRPSNPR